MPNDTNRAVQGGWRRPGFGHRLEIVSLVSVHEHAIGQRRVHSRCSDIRGQQRRFGDAALRPCEGNCHFSSLEM
jgi:hypothetical protein